MSGGWNTIESDSGVFTYLLDTLGVKGVECEDLLSLDPQELAALQPVYGVIFLFKYPTDKPYTSAEKPLDGKFDHEAAGDGSLFFAQQTIQNACGTQALLSVVLNRAAPTDDSATTSPPSIQLGEHLSQFLSFTMELPPDFRGEALSNSEPIRDAHNTFSRSNPFADETKQLAEDPRDAEDAFHFVAYVPVKGVLWELDGLQPAPISHGPYLADEGVVPGGPDSFEEKVVEVLQRRVARYAESEIRFHLLAVVADQRARAKELGDAVMIREQEQKRLAWMWDNELRTHNYLPFTAEVLKGVVDAKLNPIKGGGEEAWEGYMAENMAIAKKRQDAEKQARQKILEARRVAEAGGDAEMMG